MGFLRLLRDQDWITGDTAFRMVRAMAIGLGLSIAVIFLTAHDGVDHNGIQLGGDFVTYWAAAHLAWTGHPAAPYDLATITALEHASVPLPDGAILPFFYPPPWLLLILPLAWMPYTVAWFAFCFVTAMPLICFAWRLLPEMRMRMAIFGFPIWSVVGLTGQNGFFSGSCYAAFAVLLDTQPFWAGVAVGFLVCKPQLAVGAGVALLAGRRWKAVAGAAVSGAALMLGSLAVFGAGAWQAFFQHVGAAEQTLTTSLVFLFNVVSVTSMARLLGAPHALAFVLQAAVGVASLATLAWVAWRRPGGHYEASLAALATLLADPFTNGYDLPMSAVAMCVLLVAGAKRGFLPWDKTILIAGYVLPLVAPAIARYTHVQIGPFVLTALFFAIARRFTELESVFFFEKKNQKTLSM
jgi:hypothetical protein